MKQSPKFRKYQKPHLPAKCQKVFQKHSQPNSVGLQSLETVLISFGQLEAARRTIVRNIDKKQGQLLIRVFPSFPITKFPAEVRMGGGKGAVNS